MKPTPIKHAFTLVEILVVLVIISIMGAMVTTAVSGVTTTAKQARTKTIISIVDSVIAEHYDALKYRPLPVEIPDLFNPSRLNSGNGSTEIGFEVLANEAARVRLMMIRDLQRMEIPDRLSDLAAAPTPLFAAANKVVIDDNTNVIFNTRDQKNLRTVFQATWYEPNATYLNGGDNVPSKLAAYRNRVASNLDFTAPEALSNQGAECLYLIMATSFVGGVPAINAIPDSNIGDTDEDGLLEILDGWGQPLGFIRWPVGYFDPELSIDTTIPDDFDLFRADYAYVPDPNTASSAYALDVNATEPDKTRLPWSMRPLIYSAGADGEFGIVSNPWTASATEVTDFNYQASNWFWPTTVEYYGLEQPGRSGAASRPFPDPYLRRFIALNRSNGAFLGKLPGQLLNSSDAVSQVADNITNYQLQVSPR